jgi:hypothetical protein
MLNSVVRPQEFHVIVGCGKCVFSSHDLQITACILQYLQQNNDGSFSKITVFTGPHRGPRQQVHRGPARRFPFLGTRDEQTLFSRATLKSWKDNAVHETELERSGN